MVRAITWAAIPWTLLAAFMLPVNVEYSEFLERWRVEMVWDRLPTAFLTLFCPLAGALLLAGRETFLAQPRPVLLLSIGVAGALTAACRYLDWSYLTSWWGVDALVLIGAGGTTTAYLILGYHLDPVPRVRVAGIACAAVSAALCVWKIVLVFPPEGIVGLLWLAWLTGLLAALVLLATGRSRIAFVVGGAALAARWVAGAWLALEVTVADRYPWYAVCYAVFRQLINDLALYAAFAIAILAVIEWRARTAQQGASPPEAGV